jgi:hypothetical protein
MFVQNGFSFTKNSNKKIRNSSSETLAMISNVHGKGMASNWSHLSFPTITNEIQQKLESYDNGNKAQLFK